MRRSRKCVSLALTAMAALSCSDSTAPNQRPVATITAPSSGSEAFAGDPVSFQGSATDAESGTLTGESLLWQSDLDGVLGTGGLLTRSDLSTGTHRITLSATDPAGGSGTASVSLSIVENRAPVVSIVSPADGTQVLAGVEVSLSGSANDPEDGAVPAAALAWGSNLDGSLGSGAQISTASLSVGTHTISLTATDTRGLAGTSSIALEVLANGVPSVTISEPVDGLEALEGTEVTFVGEAVDAEDGAVTGDALSWSSSLDGDLGTGGTVSTTSLSLGDHVVTLTASDLQGQTGSASVSLRITSLTGLAPEAGFTVSCAGLTCDFSDTSTDADGTVTAWNWDFGDGTSSSEVDPQHTYATGGPYNVSLVVTDDSGNESDAAMEALSLSTPVQAGFQVETRVSPGSELTASQREAVDAAAARWGELITGDLPEYALDVSANICGIPTPALDETVDDVVIYLSFTEIDGPGRILGSAGPCWIRDAGYLPVFGIMRFDTADLEVLEEKGLLEDVILHEMGHVLGFGTLWSLSIGGGITIFDFLNDPTDPASPTVPDSVPSNDTHFDGPFAIVAFDDVSDPDYVAGAKVPLENDNQTPPPVFGQGSLNGHWREAVFTSELMTPAIGLGANPVSLVTVESLRDMGYEVNAAAVDPFGLDFNLVSGLAATVVDLGEDVWRGPIMVGDRAGRVVGNAVRVP